MICPNCKTNNPDNANFCEMCGAPLVQQNNAQPNNVQQPMMPQGRMSGKAIAGFVLSLVGLCIAGIIMGILGIIFSSLAMKEINADPTVRGKGFAIAGLVVSIIALVGAVLSLLALPDMMYAFF